MIFDSELAAAARRHLRAQKKAAKQLGEQVEQQSASQSGYTGIGNPREGTPKKGEADRNTSPIPSAEGSETGPGNTGTIIRAGSNWSATSSSTTVLDGFSKGRPGSTESSNGDVDGIERMGPVGPRPRLLKPRVLLKIIVLGCSNVSYQGEKKSLHLSSTLSG